MCISLIKVVSLLVLMGIKGVGSFTFRKIDYHIIWGLVILCKLQVIDPAFISEAIGYQFRVVFKYKRRVELPVESLLVKRMGSLDKSVFS